MAHEVKQMAYANEVPWHGLGNRLEVGASMKEWRTAAGLDWQARLAPVQFEDDKASMHQVEDRKVLYRSDNKEWLGVVSDRYQPVQPAMVLEFFKEVTEDLKIFTLETAGALRGGKRIWALAKADDDLMLGKEDKISRYLLLATSYDRSMATIVQQTSVRVVCNNTLSMAQRAGEKGGERQHRFAHGGILTVSKIKQALELDIQWSSFAKVIKDASKTKIDLDRGMKYFEEVFYPRISVEARGDKGVQKRIEQLVDIYQNAPGQDLKSTRGTAWGFSTGAATKQRALDLVTDLV